MAVGDLDLGPMEILEDLPMTWDVGKRKGGGCRW